MGFFSFIESFFFLSLGITFVLIFLMVFHFKQRVEQLEKKSENMLEVCNGLVQQIHGLKTFCISNPSPSLGSTKISENITFSTSSPIPIPDLTVSEVKSNTFQKIVVEEFDDSEEEESEEEEDFDVSDELDIPSDIPEKVDLDLDLQEIEEVDLLEDPIEAEPSQEITIEAETEVEELPVPVEVEAEELPVPSHEAEELPVPSHEAEEMEIQPEEDIKNLSLQQLRQLATQKGISNPNKMKKQELIHLLQKPSNEKSLRDLALLL